MGTPRPFQFDNFVIADNAAPAVLDLNINRPVPAPSADECARLLADIDARLQLLLGEANAHSLKLIKLILGELSPALLEKESLAIAAAFIGAKFPELTQEKVLDFYFHPDIIYDIQPRLAALAEKNNYEGQLLLHKDPSLARCDCRICWGKNKSEYNGKQRTAAILTALSAPKKEKNHD